MTDYIEGLTVALEAAANLWSASCDEEARLYENMQALTVKREEAKAITSKHHAKMRVIGELLTDLGVALNASGSAVESGEAAGDEEQVSGVPIEEYVRGWYEHYGPCKLADMIPAATSGLYPGVLAATYSSELAKLKKAGVIEFRDGLWRKVEAEPEEGRFRAVLIVKDGEFTKEGIEILTDAGIEQAEAEAAQP